MGNAKKEIAIGKRYKYVVVNDTVERAVADIKAILVAEHSRVDLNAHLFEELEAE
jgi:guanylate kinase